MLISAKVCYGVMGSKGEGYLYNFNCIALETGRNRKHCRDFFVLSLLSSLMAFILDLSSHLCTKGAFDVIPRSKKFLPKGQQVDWAQSLSFANSDE